MMSEPTGPISLRRCDPSRNMARFYELALQPTLFNEIALVRIWGRIGTHGRSKCETFADAMTAEAARNRVLHRKRQRGYAAVAR
ncbi:MAG: WGR domain-containing protein [Luteolibacter sp.]